MAEQNIALNRPTSASSFVKPYESARAVNGAYGSTTPTSRWLCNSLPGWLMVDLGVNGSYAYWINRWVVRHMTVAGWRSPDYNMSDFKLQGSNDNKAWYDIDSVVGNTVGITDRTFTAVSYRYVRLYVSKGLKCNTKMASAMELEVYQSPPLSAYLVSGTGLTVGSLTLNPTFVNNVFNYTTTQSVANSVESIAVKPTAEDSRATIKVNGVVVTSGNSTNVALNVGSNAISVQVTAADGRTTNTYTVTVVRDAAPVVAELSGLSITPGSLNETFSPSTLAYTASVGYDVASITVTPSTTISGATIKVKGVVVASGTASAAIPLNVGNGNVIDVVVTNGTATKTYTITVTRASSPYLSNLVINDSATSTPIVLSPGFAPRTLTGYVSTVAYSVANVTIIPTPEDSRATVKVTVNGTVISGSPITSALANLNPNTNTILVEVTAYDNSATKTYSITVTRNHSTLLSTLVINKVGVSGVNPTWNTPFSSSGLSYTVTATTAQVKVTPTAQDSSSTITMKVDGVVTPITTNIVVPSAGGQKIITIEVTSAFGIPTTTYTITLVKG